MPMQGFRLRTSGVGSNHSGTEAQCPYLGYIWLQDSNPQLANSCELSLMVGGKNAIKEIETQCSQERLDNALSCRQRVSQQKH